MKRSAVPQGGKTANSSIKKSKPNQQQQQHSTKPTAGNKISSTTKSKKPSTTAPKSQLTNSNAQNDVFAMGDDSSEDDSDEKREFNNNDDDMVSLDTSAVDEDQLLEIKKQITQMNRMHKMDQKTIESAVNRAAINNSLANPQEGFTVGEEQEEEEEDDGEELPLPPPPNPDCFNPFLEAYYAWLKQSPKDIERLFDPSLPDDRRRVLIDFLPTKSQRQYAWAIPTTEAIQTLYHFSPIIEVGAGKGYWGSLLRKFAAKQLEATGQCKVANPFDVYVGFDCQPAPEKGDDMNILHLEYKKQNSDDKQSGFLSAKQTKKQSQSNEPMKYIKDDEHPSWTKILIGDSNELKRPKYRDHTMFLCYPDDFEFSERSLALDCLRKFTGQYIITVGESLGETRQENPWGRSADGQFQQHLADQFHKIATIPLPSFHSSCDSLSIWKRTIKCVIDRTEDDDGIVFRYVPSVEKLTVRAFAPCLGDLDSMLQEAPTFLEETSLDILLSKGSEDDDDEEEDNNKDDDDEDVPDLIDGVQEVKKMAKQQQPTPPQQQSTQKKSISPPSQPSSTTKQQKKPQQLDTSVPIKPSVEDMLAKKVKVQQQQQSMKKVGVAPAKVMLKKKIVKE